MTLSNSPSNSPIDLLLKNAQRLLRSDEPNAEHQCCVIIDQINSLNQQSENYNAMIVLSEIAKLSLQENKMGCIYHLYSIKPDRVNNLISSVFTKNDVNNFLKLKDFVLTSLKPASAVTAYVGPEDLLGQHQNQTRPQNLYNGWTERALVLIAQHFNNEHTPLVAELFLQQIHINDGQRDWKYTNLLQDAITHNNTAFIDFILPRMNCNYDDAHIVSYAIHKDNWDAVEKIIPHLNEKNLHQEVFPQIVEERNLQALHFIYPYIDPNTIVAYYEKQKWNTGEEFVFITDFFTKKHLEKSLKEISPKESTNKRKI